MPSKFKKRAKKRGDAFSRADVAGWITPDLENHPVGAIGAHHDWAINHFNLPKDSDPGARQYIGPYIVAFVRG